MINQSIKDYYESNLQKHGAGAQGVGWKNEEAQQQRFSQLVKVIYTDSPFSVNDLGCGTGDLLNFLNVRYKQISYTGYDVMPEMITRAKEHHHAAFSIINDASEMLSADYTMASGIFNLRVAVPDDQWREYILTTLNTMNSRSTKGFAFNALTSYSDPERMDGNLYYSDPKWLFDYCKRNFAKNVALLHDYDMYDFTILVKKNF